MKELDEHLLPTEKVPEDILKGLVDVPEEVTGLGEPQPGTRKRKHVYPMHDFEGYLNLTGARISFKLYSISITSNNSNNEFISINSKNSINSLGLMSQKDIVSSPFTLFSQKLGELEVELTCVKDVLTINEENLQLIKKFHELVFKSLINLSSYMFEPTKGKGILIAPLLNNCDIDLEILSEVASAKSIWKEVQLDKPYESIFSDSIVQPFYKEKGAMFFVENLLKNMSPLSEFPENKKLYKTFADYYEKNYKITIRNLNQPLLECKNVPKELNYVNERDLKCKRQKSKPPLLVPELVNVLVFPASFWRQIMCLPSILHCINNLNISYELCCRIGSIPVQNIDELQTEYVDIKWSEKKLQSILENNDNICVALSTKINSVLHPMKLLQALTLASSNTDFNLEQLEVLGDSFLKYATSEFVFMKFKDDHEGKMTQRRCVLISNRTLYGRAKVQNLPPNLQSLPPNLRVHGLLPGFIVRKEVCEELLKEGLDADLWHKINESQPDDVKKAVCNLMQEKKEKDDNQNVHKNKRTSREKCANTGNLLHVKNDKECIEIEILSSHISIDTHELDHTKNDNSSIAMEVESSTNANYNQAMNVHKSTPMEIDSSSYINHFHKQHEVFNPWSHQKLSDKSIADAVEALIGVHLLVGGEHSAYNFLNWLGIELHQTEENEVNFLPDAIICTETWAKEEVLDIYKRICLDKLEAILQYTFNEKSFLVQAVTHSSCVQNKVTECYQRLEFLGDAVLDYLITGHIYAQQKNCTPGQMTDLRSHFVNNTSLANVSARLKLQQYLLHSNPKLQASIGRFLESTNSSDESTNSSDELHELLSQLELNTEDDTDDVDEIEVPKALGDLVEAIIGAVYLDSGKSLQETWKVIKIMLGDKLNDTSPDNIPINFMKKIYEKYPGEGQIIFNKIPKESDEKAEVEIEIYQKNGLTKYIGFGKNYRIAKQNAIKKALSI